jgi:hypothetical protein
LPAGGEPLQTSPGGPDGFLLKSIASGELDLHLPALARAIDARLHLLHTMWSIDALAELVVGDLVRISHRARPRYLHGQPATVVDVDAQATTIRLERPIGRLTSGRLRCPPLALDRLGPALR